MDRMFRERRYMKEWSDFLESESIWKTTTTTSTAGTIGRVLAVIIPNIIYKVRLELGSQKLMKTVRLLDQCLGWIWGWKPARGLVVVE